MLFLLSLSSSPLSFLPSSYVHSFPSISSYASFPSIFCSPFPSFLPSFFFPSNLMEVRGMAQHRCPLVSSSEFCTRKSIFVTPALCQFCQCCIFRYSITCAIVAEHSFAFHERVWTVLHINLSVFSQHMTRFNLSPSFLAFITFLLSDLAYQATFARGVLIRISSILVYGLN